jgi:hypothetical protein
LALQTKSKTAQFIPMSSGYSVLELASSAKKRPTVPKGKMVTEGKEQKPKPAGVSALHSGRFNALDANATVYEICALLGVIMVHRRMGAIQQQASTRSTTTPEPTKPRAVMVDRHQSIEDHQGQR